MRHWWAAWTLALFAVMLAVTGLVRAWPQDKPVATGDQACARCHQAIVARYEASPMAKGSGPAAAGMLTGGFTHQASGVTYNVALSDGAAVMRYERTAGSADGALKGERTLKLFVGSGKRGRTYLYEEDGLWFEAPINYYTKKAVWDMAPNFGAARAMPDGLPVDPNCLHCHATDVKASTAGARNRFAGAPFVVGGIGCASCHGDAAAHLAHPARGNIVNPDKLTAVRRDGVCLQCHLEGDAAIYRAGKELVAFKPGDDLSDYVDYFVKAGAEGGGGRAASEYEALLRSACRRAVGDKLTCTTCHDPHGSPAPEERVAYFRARCLSCHTGAVMATKHHAEQQNCAVCHMPSRVTTDISHEQTTDHDIEARPALRLAAMREDGYKLVPVGLVRPGDREYGLAYAQAAIGGTRAAFPEARRYLEAAEAAGADDAELHAQLGLIEQIGGDAHRAAVEYARALTLDPGNATAEGNAAVLAASNGHADEAVGLLKRVVAGDPSQVTAGLNLAYIECVTGEREQARAVLKRLLRFSPDDQAVRGFLEHGTYAGRRCAVQP